MRIAPLLLCLVPCPEVCAQLHGPGPARGPLGAGSARVELAGKPLERYPHFAFVRSFNEGEPIRIAIDTRRFPHLAKRTVDVVVFAHGRLGEFLGGQKLDTLAPAPLTVKLAQGGVDENVYLLDPGTLKGDTGTTTLGTGYDVAVDVNGNSLLDGADLLDGGADGAGFYVLRDYVTLRPGTKETGPYSVVELLYSGGTTFTRQDIYYPANIAELGELPLVVVSHGNGHNYTWYDHIGYHLASWGYVVMSHSNNTAPGIETASTTTLRNTNHFLANLAKIAGGALLDHVDGHRIVWIGHSRGGEGVVYAYRRLLDGDPLATQYTAEDVLLVSSMAPVDFLGPGRSDVGSVTYHLWTGGADADVNGCADCNLCQTFHLHERADGARFSISLHGVGHGDFHDGGGDSVASGPCQVGRENTHAIMRGYLLPLLQFVLDGNPACQDYLWRQWENLRPLAAPEAACVVVDLMYQEAPGPAKLVLDDFQSNPSPFLSSSGRAVVPTFELSEGLLDDANNSFTWNELDVMNGMTLAGFGDASSGVTFGWDMVDESLTFELPPGTDLGQFSHLSFRAAQASRDPLTNAERGDLDFSVQVVDADLDTSTIAISAYGGGIEEPYLRRNCGTGAGWANEFETIRIPLGDFLAEGRPLDLGRAVAVSFLFGPSHGSAQGRIGLDEIEFTRR